MSEQMLTGDICRRIGLTISAEMLQELGFEPIGRNKRAVLWDQRDYPAMCVSVGKWIADRQTVPMQPKPAPPKRVGKKEPAATTTSQEDDDDEL